MTEDSPVPGDDPRVPLLILEDARFAYKDGPEVLKGVDLVLERGETVALLGTSGSGKSTLLFLAGLLARPTHGRIFLLGQDTGRLGEVEREHLRNERLGFVFQHHFLLPDFSAEENVALPAWIQRGRSGGAALERAREVLDFVGLGPLAHRRPNQLSGGERQRVAIARALAHRPDMVLADEPTGSLDTENGEKVFELLFQLKAAHGCGVLLVTHNPALAERCDRVIRLADGQVVEAPRTSETASSAANAG